MSNLDTIPNSEIIFPVKYGLKREKSKLVICNPLFYAKNSVHILNTVCFWSRTVCYKAFSFVVCKFFMTGFHGLNLTSGNLNGKHIHFFDMI